MSPTHSARIPASADCSSASSSSQNGWVRRPGDRPQSPSGGIRRVHSGRPTGVHHRVLPITTVPLDSTTYVTLKDEERERLRKHRLPVTRALEALPVYGWENHHVAHDPARSARSRGSGGLPPAPSWAERHALAHRGRQGLHEGGDGKRQAHDRVLPAEARQVMAACTWTG